MKNVELNKNLQLFWAEKSMSIPSSDSDITTDVNKHFRGELKFDMKESRYEVKLPFKEEHDLLPDNYTHCVQRLDGLKKKLAKGPELLKLYNEIIKDQISTGVIETVSMNDAIPTAGQVYTLFTAPYRCTNRQNNDYSAMCL